jgi:hypothetical protein
MVSVIALRHVVVHNLLNTVMQLFFYEINLSFFNLQLFCLPQLARSQPKGMFFAVNECLGFLFAA